MLLNPRHVTNPAWRHELVADAFGVEPAFDWQALARITDAEHARAIHEIEHPKPARKPLRKPSAIIRRDRYVLAALEGEAHTVASAPAGNRNNVLARSAFKIGQLGAAFDSSHAEAVLLAAARDVGLPDREAIPVIRRGLRAGALHPRKVSA